jgi:citrate lyase subunit beta/citryl-CoA lyase
MDTTYITGDMALDDTHITVDLPSDMSRAPEDAPGRRKPSRLSGKFLRSVLFSPGQRERMIEKALGTDADAVILDLEDGVPPAEKDVARERVAVAINRPRSLLTPLRIVRVNPAATGRLNDDLGAVVGIGLDAILLPKVECPEEIHSLDRALGELEARTGLEAGSVAIVAAIESARGIEKAVDILCASERLAAAMFGAEDLALELGLPVRRRGAGQEMLHARSALVLAAAIGRVRPLDQVWLDFRDFEGLRAEAIAGRDMGFAGKCLIHPGQIAIVNEVFSPSSEDVELAQRVVAAFEEAKAAGIGAVMLGGQLVELPIVERAQQTLRADSEIGARRGFSRELS